ncbi:hypothetical protein FRB97_002396 [Tulasnella sp. 331]|nr:hypothetical protein FRB97_002396 [Tulasnella sp. 331]
MNSVRVDKEVMIGSIQGGTTVGHAQVELLKPGPATPPGHGGTVEATVGLANGKIVHASASENSDLLWNIKGGEYGLLSNESKFASQSSAFQEVQIPE